MCNEILVDIVINDILIVLSVFGFWCFVEKLRFFFRNGWWLKDIDNNLWI